MSERVKQAEVFPQGWDWFWLAWGLGWLVFDGVTGILWLGILVFLLALVTIGVRRATRILDARHADWWEEVRAELTELDNIIKQKEKEHGRNKSGRAESSSKEQSKRP